ncbi:hypothetical protein Daus18300_012896 [Diaporthe australafricana]|uniref:Uncharacterized protein n=1 Tax=Diaporthe australafricana TaxID=127596 RepID=A0ABR3W160_9PEZI
MEHIIEHCNGKGISGGLEAKGDEGDYGLCDTYSILPPPSTQTSDDQVSQPRHLQSSEAGDSQSENDDISQSWEEGESHSQNDDMSQRSEAGESQPQNDNISQSPQPDVSHRRGINGAHVFVDASIPACNDMFPV